MLAQIAPGVGPLDFGTALIAAVDDPANAVIVLTPGLECEVPEERLLTLLTGDHRIGAVVPQVRRPDGRLVEAGVVSADGRQLSRHAAEADPEVAWTAADVDGTRYPWLAFRRDLLAGSFVDASLPPSAAAALALELTRTRGLRTVYDPTWVVTTTDPGSGPVPTAVPLAAESSVPRVLVVTPFLVDGSFRPDDRFARSIIHDLISFADPASVTVAVLDGFDSAACAGRLRAAGVRVVTAPTDWDGWFIDHWGAFDQVLVLSDAISGALLGRLKATQPQAVPILCVDSLPFRAIEQLRPTTPPEEHSGTKHFADVSASIVQAWLPQFRGVLCRRSDDAAYLRSMAPGGPVVQTAPSVPDRESHEPLSRREGIAVVANDGYDVTSGNEEAVQAVLDDILPALRHRRPSVPVTVLSDTPSPLLRKLVEEQGLALAPMERAREVLGRVRLLLALHHFGTGGSEAVVAAIGSRTPFVASVAAVAGLDLGAVGNVSVFGDPADLCNRANRLLVDDEYWRSVRDSIDQLARTVYRPEARRDALRSLLTTTGWFAPEKPRTWPVSPAEAGRPAPLRTSALPRIRPGMEPRVALGPMPQPASFELRGDDRYRVWHERHGASAETFRVLREELGKLTARPLISVVMPVYNTEPSLLTRTVDSLREQLYEDWELCIADDASTREDTARLLDELDADPQIHVVRLPGNSGISAATNAALRLAQGEFVAFMDHDDLLKPHALAQVARWLDAAPTLDVIYTDEDKIDDDGLLSEPHLKPDWSPDLLMSVNYISHLTVMRRSLVEGLGGLRSEFDGSQDYDLLLRATELTDRIAHIPEPLYSWRISDGSAAGDSLAKPYAVGAAKRALADALKRRGRQGRPEATRFPTFYRTRYAIPGTPKVSIVIPTRDGIDLLRTCINSVLERSTYPNFDIVVVDNQSSDGKTLEFLARSAVRVLRYPHRFNYSRQMNLAAAWAESEVLLFLNNDTEVITPDWIESLLEHAMRPEVGAVGARLFYGDGTVQHEGIIVGGAGGHAWNVDTGGYFARGELVRNVSAVTGACVMMRSTVYSRIGGNDERLRIAYNDVDICLRVRQAGLEVVYTPYAELFHYEGASRKGAEDEIDGPMFEQRWQIRNSWDPYHSPLFLNTRTDTAFLLAI